MSNFSFYKKSLILLLIILFGAFLRFYHLDSTPLWQDEAETAILAENILKEWNHHGVFNGAVIFTGRLKEKECLVNCTYLDPSKYEFSQVDYDDNGELRYGPLSILYLVSTSYFLFGISTLTTRLFPTIISIMALFFLYKLGELFYNRLTGLVAILLYSINSIMISHDRFAEYDSLNLLAFLSTICFMYSLLFKRDTRFIIPSIISLTLLVYTNPIIALSLLILSIAYVTYKRIFFKHHLNNYFIVLILMVFLFSVPFIIYLFKLVDAQPIFSPTKEYTDRLRFKFANIFFLSMLTTSGYISVIGFLLSFLSKKKMILNIIFGFALISLLFFIPSAHLFDRTIIFAIPLFTIYSGHVFSIALKNKQLLIKIISLIALLITLFLPFLLSYPILFLNDYRYNFYKVTNSTSYFASPLYGYVGSLIKGDLEPIKNKQPWEQSGWVKDTIEFLEKKNVGPEPIFVTHQNLVFNFYSNLSVELVWPIKKDFFESIKGRYWIILEPNKQQLDDICRWFYYDINPENRLFYYHISPEEKYINPENKCIKKNYDTKIKQCRKTKLRSNAQVYECNYNKTKEGL